MKNASVWQAIELEFTGTLEFANPYLDFDFEVDFISPSGTKLTRPAFWNGGNSWIVRFAAPTPGVWKWHSNSLDPAMTGRGEFDVVESASSNEFFKHGFLKMSPQGRSVVHADGTPFSWQLIRPGLFLGEQQSKTCKFTLRIVPPNISMQLC